MNRVLRRMSGLRRDEVTGVWWRLYKEKLHNLPAKYYSGDRIKQNWMGETCDTYGGVKRLIQVWGREEAYTGMGERRGLYRVWWGNLN